MKRQYLRAHPQSPLGNSYTTAHANGWALVCFGADGYPIFRETFSRWFKRVIGRVHYYEGSH